MARKSKKDSEKKFVITEEQIIKFRRKARREADLEARSFIRGGAHKTSKRDEEERISGSLSEEEIAEMLEMEKLQILAEDWD